MAFGLSELNGLVTARNGAHAQGITVEQYIGSVEHWAKQHETDRSDNETRIAAKPLIFAMFQADPAADLNPRDVVAQVGLRNCQADRAFVAWQLKQARLTYQPRGAANAA